MNINTAPRDEQGRPVYFALYVFVAQPHFVCRGWNVSVSGASPNNGGEPAAQAVWAVGRDSAPDAWLRTRNGPTTRVWLLRLILPFCQERLKIDGREGGSEGGSGGGGVSRRSRRSRSTRGLFVLVCFLSVSLRHIELRHRPHGIFEREYLSPSVPELIIRLLVQQSDSKIPTPKKAPKH